MVATFAEPTRGDLGGRSGMGRGRYAGRDGARGCVCNVCKVDFTMYVLVGGKTVGCVLRMLCAA